jgi:hypothetical protein
MCLMVGILVDPAAAGHFEVSIIRCGSAGTSSGCGSNPAATHPLKSGKVKLDGQEVDVELYGAVPNATYRILVGNWINGGLFQSQFTGTGTSGSIGSITTDGNGDFYGPVKTDSGVPFIFPANTVIGQPNFAFNSSGGTSQFTTGFKITAGVATEVLPHFAVGASYATGFLCCQHEWSTGKLFDQLLRR